MFKADKTFSQHFISYFPCELLLDSFAHSPNMLDQHSCKKEVNIIEITTLKIELVVA